MLKILKKILYWTVGSILSLALLLTLVTLIFEDEIKQKAVEELNRHLNTEVKVREINLSLWKKWPYASLEFTEVYIPDAYENRKGGDTLLYADRVFLEFDISAIWNEDYKVEVIEVEEGTLNIRRDAAGNGNYHILKSSPDDEESNVDFQLRDIRLVDMQVNYMDQHAGHHLYTHMEDGHLSGEFASSNFDLNADLDFHLKEWRDQSITMLRNRDVDLSTVISVYSDSSNWDIKKGELTIDQMALNLLGRSHNGFLDMSLSGKNLDLADLIAGTHLPAIEGLRKHHIEGKANLDMAITMDTVMVSPKIIATFDINNGRFHEPGLGVDASAISLHSTYSQHEGISSIYVEDFKMDLIEGHVEGRANIANFAEPLLEIELRGDAQLSEVRNLLHWNQWEKLSGHADMDLDLLIKLPRQDIRNDDMRVEDLKGKLALANVHGKYQGYPAFIATKGSFNLSPTSVGVKGLELAVGNSDLKLNGTIQQFQEFLNGQSQLKLLMDAKSSNLVVTDFYGEQSSGTSEGAVVLPTGVYARVNTRCEHIEWAGHDFDKVSGTIELSDKTISSPFIRFLSSGGQWKGNLTIKELSPGRLGFKGKQNLSNVSISDFFKEWNDFDQTSITHEQIEGKLYSDIDYAFVTDGKGNVDYSSLVASIDVTIHNGRIHDLSSMNSVMEFLRGNAGAKVVLGSHLDDLDRRLSDIRFSRLSNQILIKDQMITIPDMDIGNSALDLHFQGTHSLADIIDYKFNFRFRDLKMDQSDTEFGFIEDDNTGIRVFLRMFGHLDDPEFELDKEAQKANRQEMIAQEKETVKSMLKKEFGLFSGDSTVNSFKEKKRPTVEVLVGEDAQAHDKRVDKDKKRILADWESKHKPRKEEEIEFEWDLEEN